MSNSEVVLHTHIFIILQLVFSLNYILKLI